METNYSRWKPILLVCRFSDPYFYFFFCRSPFFCLRQPFNFFSFPHLYRRLSTLLLPLHFTASVKPTTPLSLLPFTTKQISESSSIFALFSDRNLLGMDEKFAISLGWMSRSSGIFPSLNVSLLLLHDHFTNPGYPTVVKPSTLMTPCQFDNSSLYRRLGTFLATSFPFTASVKPSTLLYFSLIGQHDTSNIRRLSVRSLPLTSFLVSRTPSAENGNQRQSIYTKYNRW